MNKIRTARNDGRLWFVARDIARYLEYASAKGSISTLFRSIPSVWKKKNSIQTLGGMQDMLCISEEGLSLFLERSDKSKSKFYQILIASDASMKEVMCRE